jgi:hypothetical protein
VESPRRIDSPQKRREVKTLYLSSRYEKELAMSLGIQLPDFDVLMALHQRDPEAFEEFRRRLLREAVEYAPPVHHPALERLLRRIEEARKTAATPMEAALIASRMMQESLSMLHNTWEEALHAVAGLQTALLIERMRSK